MSKLTTITLTIPDSSDFYVIFSNAKYIFKIDEVYEMANNNFTHAPIVAIIPRIIRIRDAPFYLGMDKNRFNKEVRPYVPEIKIGMQGVAFDRLDLDAWFDDYITKAA